MKSSEGHKRMIARWLRHGCHRSGLIFCDIRIPTRAHRRFRKSLHRNTDVHVRRSRRSLRWRRWLPKARGRARRFFGTLNFTEAGPDGSLGVFALTSQSLHCLPWPSLPTRVFASRSVSRLPWSIHGETAAMICSLSLQLILER